MRMKRALLLLFLLLAGVVLGALLASACADVDWLSWMAFSRQIGFNPESPLVLDLSVLRFSFGFAVDISVAQILAMAAAIALYTVLRKKL